MSNWQGQPDVYDGAFWDWVESKSAKDLPALRLKYGRQEPYFTAIAQVHARTALAKKFPTLVRNRWLFPSGVSLEQSSSEPLAKFKAQLLEGLLVEAGLTAVHTVDLTGGMGMDSWAFSCLPQVGRQVLIEPQHTLVQLYAHILPGAEVFETTAEHFLEGGALDQWLNAAAVPSEEVLFFVDPDRRAKGVKVAQLKDAQPNLLSLQPHLLNRGRWVLSKHSPMASIEELRELECLKALWVVQWRGENKEILALQEAHFFGEATMTAVELEPFFKTTGPVSLPAAKRGTSTCKTYLIQPGPALIKSGLHALWAEQFGWTKLLAGMLYTADQAPASNALYKMFEVIAVGRPYKIDLPILELAIESIGFPDSAEQVRKRLKAKEGRTWKLFALGYGSTKEMILCRLME